MFVTSTWANSKGLSMLCSLTTCCSDLPNVIVVPTVTLGPSGPHRFLESLSEKCAWMEKNEFE